MYDDETSLFEIGKEKMCNFYINDIFYQMTPNSMKIGQIGLLFQGTLNGTRGVSCKNGACNYVFKEVVVERRKFSNFVSLFTPPRLLTYHIWIYLFLENLEILNTI